MAILNIKYGKDLITLDDRLSQVRYVHDIKNRGNIEFFNIPSYKFNEEIAKFNSSPKFIKETVAEYLGWKMGKTFDIKKMRIKR